MKFKGAGDKQSLDARSFPSQLHPHRQLVRRARGPSSSVSFPTFQNLLSPSSSSSFPFKATGTFCRYQAGTSFTPIRQRPLGHGLSSLCKASPHPELRETEPAQLAAFPGPPGALTDVGVAEGILGMAGRACARFRAPVPKAPAAQEHDKPEPGSHGSCCGPLRGLPLLSSKLPSASADAPVRAHLLGLTVHCAR